MTLTLTLTMTMTIICTICCSFLILHLIGIDRICKCHDSWRIWHILLSRIWIVIVIVCKADATLLRLFKRLFYFNFRQQITLSVCHVETAICRLSCCVSMMMYQFYWTTILNQSNSGCLRLCLCLYELLLIWVHFVFRFACGGWFDGDKRSVVSRRGILCRIRSYWSTFHAKIVTVIVVTGWIR